MIFSGVKSVVIPAGKVKSITRASDGVLLWKGGYTNQVPLSIDTDGSVYNGVGYKRMVRVRSGGGEATNVPYASCTGYIPAVGGDVIRISNCMFDYAGNMNAINVYDSNFSCLGQWTMLPAEYGVFLSSGSCANYSYDTVVEESDGVWRWVVPPDAGIAYIRATVYDTVSGGPYEMIVTVNEEVTA